MVNNNTFHNPESTCQNEKYLDTSMLPFAPLTWLWLEINRCESRMLWKRDLDAQRIYNNQWKVIYSSPFIRQAATKCHMPWPVWTNWKSCFLISEWRTSLHVSIPSPCPSPQWLMRRRRIVGVNTFARDSHTRTRTNRRASTQHTCSRRRSFTSNKMVDIDRCSTSPLKLVFQKQINFKPSSNSYLSGIWESMHWIRGIGCRARCVKKMDRKIERLHCELFKSRRKRA
jgi:hypothetical protein